MPYQKHNIYTSAYTIAKDGALYPEQAKFIVYKRVGESTFSQDLSNEGSIVLILEDTKKSFWSVMSFLTLEDAQNLLTQLQEAIKEY